MSKDQMGKLHLMKTVVEKRKIYSLNSANAYKNGKQVI